MEKSHWIDGHQAAIPMLRKASAEETRLIETALSRTLVPRPEDGPPPFSTRPAPGRRRPRR